MPDAKIGRSTDIPVNVAENSTAGNGQAPAGNESRNAPQTKLRAAPVRKSDAICAEICARIAGGETLTAILADCHMPSVVSFHRWLERDQSLSNEYARARIRQADFFADQIVDLSNGAIDGDSAQAAKVKCWARMWHASKMNPKKYGEKAGDVHVTTAIGVVLPEEKRLELMERQRAAEALPESGGA